MNTENSLSESDVVLVTGGTGFTGKVLVRRLCEAGCKVRVIARPSSDRSALEDLPIEWYLGDVYDEAIVEKAAADVQYIFHVAAAYREAKISDHIYELVHVKSTQLLAAAALKNSRFKRFIHVSTVGVLGHIDNPPADESTAYNPGDIYQETKTKAEQWILNAAKEDKLPLTVIRPAAIYGPGDERLLKVFKFAKLPIVPLIGFTKGLYHLIHVDDLVGFILSATTNNKTIGNIYICGNTEAVSIKEIINTVADHIGTKPIYLRLPALPFFAIGWLCETLCKPLGIEPPIYPRRVAFFTKDRSFNTEKMRNHTGYVYKYSNQQGLKATADWYIEHGWL